MKRALVLLKSDQRGAVFVEHIIAYMPVMFFFMATWQLLDMCAAHLILKRAASAAARAAVVVLPDDPAYYDKVPKDSFSGKRKEDIEFAAELILSASPHFSSDAKVEIASNFKAGDPLTATVKAKFHCFAGWVSLVCGPTGIRELTAKSIYAYQGASYNYELCERTMTREPNQNLTQDSRGAILIVGIVFGVLLVGALWHIAGIGDAIAWRERAQDAADAGAFENAVWNARGMNVIAAINIVMSLVLCILVIWRTILILVTVALVIAAILCVVTFGTGCGFAAAVGRVEGFMLRNDEKVATNVIRILAAMNASQVAVASVTPIIGAARGTINTQGAYDVSYAATQSASLLPSVNPKGIQTLINCFKGAKAGKIPKPEKVKKETDDRLGKAISGSAAFYQDFLSNPRIGLGTSLPVQTESYSVLCQRAGESVLNNIAGVLERMGVPAGAIEGIDKAKTALGAIVGSLPGLFCAPISTFPQDMEDMVDKQANESCKSELPDKPRRFTGDSNGNNTVEYEDPDNAGKYISEDALLKKCTKKKKKEANDKLGQTMSSKNYDLAECGSPSKVWEWAVNGNVFMRSFAQVEKKQSMAAEDDRLLKVADLSRTAAVEPIEQDQIIAHAEMYLDCDAKRWMDCKTNAMWQLRWRARLRRIQPFERLVASAIEPGIVAMLTQLFAQSGDKLGGKLRDKLGIPKILVPKVKDTWYFRQLKTNVFQRGLYSSGAFEHIGALIIKHSDNGTTVH